MAFVVGMGRVEGWGVMGKSDESSTDNTDKCLSHLVCLNVCCC